MNAQMQMFTNGMKESSASNVFFEDVPVEAFFLLIQFMYSGELKVDIEEITPVLVELLLLSDQFGITALQFECCKRIMEFLSKVPNVLSFIEQFTNRSYWCNLPVTIQDLIGDAVVVTIKSGGFAS